MQQSDKQMKTAGAVETGEQTFMFPHNPHPIVIKAKTIEEAEKEFAKIINKGQPVNEPEQ